MRVPTHTVQIWTGTPKLIVPPDIGYIFFFYKEVHFCDQFRGCGLHNAGPFISCLEKLFYRRERDTPPTCSGGVWFCRHHGISHSGCSCQPSPVREKWEKWYTHRVKAWHFIIASRPAAPCPSARTSTPCDVIDNNPWNSFVVNVLWLPI